MKQHDLQKPLIQSAIVLVVIFILIGFVAGSDANGFIGGMVSILKGLFFTVLFTIALAIGLIVSVLLLIAIFFGAIALYSPQTSKDLFLNFRQRLKSMALSWSCCSSEGSTCSAPQTECSTSPQHDQTADELPAVSDSATLTTSSPNKIVDIQEVLSKHVDSVKNEIRVLQEQNNTLNSVVEEIKRNIPEIPASEILDRTQALETDQQNTSTNLSAGLKKIDEIESAVSKTTQAAQLQDTQLKELQNTISTLSEEILNLKDQVGSIDIKTSQSSTVVEEDSKSYRIFDYIKKQKDLTQFIKLVEEAVSQNMTYAEIDDLLSKSLPKDVDTVLKEHPSLTKDFIRDAKKQI